MLTGRNLTDQNESNELVLADFNVCIKASQFFGIIYVFYSLVWK